MNFVEAKQKLKKVAKGRYHSLRYEVTEDASGDLTQVCVVYIDGSEILEAPSWAEAFGLLAEYKIDPVEELTVK